VSTKRLTDDLWFGGTPPRVVRLTEAGRRAWRDLQHGPVASRTAGMLARRFTDAGLAHPVPPAGSIDGVTIVIPVHERATDLTRCLAALGAAHPVIVVDDASRDAAAIGRVCARFGAMLIRRERNGGAGAARNTALAHVRTEFVAFVDSDCEPPAGWLPPLLAHLADPLVAAVAPRIAARAGDTWSGRYTTAHSSLDLGDAPARVAAGSRVSYVPTAALVVRRAVLADMPFDETLRVGEDVDLIWRLNAADWRVRYAPAVQVAHREPTTWRGLLARRFRYGTSAAPLAQRHPGDLAPLVLHPWPTVTVAGVLTRRPLVAAVGFAASVLSMARALRRADVPTDGVVAAMARATVQTGLGIGRYTTQFMAPVLVAGLVARRTRFAAGALLLGPVLTAWAPDRRRLDPVRFTVGRLADEVAYGAGVWTGCVGARIAAPLRPAVVRRPLRIDAHRS
jgi:mycofactocin system glycosyltransferase